MGFALCGFTTPDSPAEYARYERWVAAGMHGEMHYLASERGMRARKDPRILLPPAQSIVLLAAPYASPPPAEKAALGGRVAAYALGDDYHDVLPDRLRRLCQAIDLLAGEPHEHRVYTDTGPILERELAVRAGLGWIGRNSMLINPSIGSFFFLAEILTSFAFPPDPAFPVDRCGTCDRCLRACPTGCIQPDRTIDARRCIACLTIEHRGVIPEDLRSQIGAWVFGCDACQTVCPWNVRAPEIRAGEFVPRAHFPLADLAAELCLTEGELGTRFVKSALRRVGRSGYRRNLALALGNTGQSGAIPALQAAAADPDPTVRESAVWALRQNKNLRKLA